MMITAPRLACEQCRNRKVRCNKASPCSACRAAGLQCHTVQRARLPRGKSGKERAQNNKLEERVARIESLLARNAELSAGVRPMTKYDHSSFINKSVMTESETTTTVYCTDMPATHLIASDFWTALSNEVNGLRDIIDSPEDDTEQENHEKNSQTGDTPTVFGTTVFMFPLADPKNVFNDIEQISLFTISKRKMLLNLYRLRVESVYKILHWPSFIQIFDGKDSQYATSTVQNIAFEALESSVYFMSICSITATEAEEMGFGDRTTILQSCRAHLERLFERSNLMNSANMTLLQAFVIYLLGLRACLNGAHTWTLVAVAVRLATALKLGDETTTIYTRFEIQLRRRLLYGIGILDTHSALDRGTVPILPSAVFAVPPLSINDVDMSPPNNVPNVSDTGLTEMSHTMMIYEAMLCQRQLYELSQTTSQSWDTWHKKLDLISSFQKYVRRLTSHINDSSAPLDKLLKISGHKILISLELLLRRPPYHNPRNSVPPWDEFDVTRAATNVLEHHLQPLSPELEPWAWKSWIQWHALAVVLAELATNPDGVESNRAYAIAKKSFQYYARIVADSKSGMLWKPIAKLMHRVEVARHDHFNKLGWTVAEHKGSSGSHPEDDLMELSNSIDDISFDFVSRHVNDHEADLSEGYNDFVNNENSGEPDMSWMAWDAFLQDISLADV
ncbi:hypothetical protein DE146DRAFT_376540 [Phaeosphaeria sp. MPI-PUGE-AT-0046c]|nr:hypothetical protein DE146DRAFT_376540 [Phaeosphaeria sp. MPI-PUGE-AT-0046c]